MPGGKGKTNLKAFWGKNLADCGACCFAGKTGGKTGGKAGDSSKTQKSHSAKAGLQVCIIVYPDASGSRGNETFRG